MKTNHELNKYIPEKPNEERLLHKVENKVSVMNGTFILSAIINSISKKRNPEKVSKNATGSKAHAKENKIRFLHHARKSDSGIPKIILDAFKIEYFNIQ